jgi:hypothetical protein
MQWTIAEPRCILLLKATLLGSKSWTLELTDHLSIMFDKAMNSSWSKATGESQVGRILQNGFRKLGAKSKKNQLRTHGRQLEFVLMQVLSQ